MELQRSEGKRDLSVIVDNELAFSEHIRVATAKANRVIGMLKNAFVYRDVDVWKTMYVILVRPHLKY